MVTEDMVSLRLMEKTLYSHRSLRVIRSNTRLSENLAFQRESSKETARNGIVQEQAIRKFSLRSDDTVDNSPKGE